MDIVCVSVIFREIMKLIEYTVWYSRLEEYCGKEGFKEVWVWWKNPFLTSNVHNITSRRC